MESNLASEIRQFIELIDFAQKILSPLKKFENALY